MIGRMTSEPLKNYLHASCFASYSVSMSGTLIFFKFLMMHKQFVLKKNTLFEIKTSILVFFSILQILKLVFNYCIVLKDKCYII